MRVRQVPRRQQGEVQLTELMSDYTEQQYLDRIDNLERITTNLLSDRIQLMKICGKLQAQIDNRDSATNTTAQNYKTLCNLFTRNSGRRAGQAVPDVAEALEFFIDGNPDKSDPKEWQRDAFRKTRIMIYDTLQELGVLK